MDNQNDKFEIIDEGFSNSDGNYVDSKGNTRNAFEEIEKAEVEIAQKKLERQTTNVHFRWFDTEVERCKKIAEAKGLKYHAYLKMVLKQALDKDEKELFQK